MGRGIVILGVQRGDCFVVSIIKELIRGSSDLIETSSRIVVGRSCSTRFGNSGVSRILSTRWEWTVETNATILFNRILTGWPNCVCFVRRNFSRETRNFIDTLIHFVRSFDKKRKFQRRFDILVSIEIWQTNSDFLRACTALFITAKCSFLISLLIFAKQTIVETSLNNQASITMSLRFEMKLRFKTLWWRTTFLKRV